MAHVLTRAASCLPHPLHWSGLFPLLSWQASRTLRTSCHLQKNLKMVRRDMRRRQCVAQYEKDRLRLRAIVKNRILPEVVQRKASVDLAEHPRDAFVTRVRNRCVLTGRGRGVLTMFRVSRMKFRKMADFGMLSGVTRSSW